MSKPSPKPILPGGYSADRLNLMIHVRRYGQILLRRWLILFLCLSAGSAGGVYLAMTRPNIYRAVSVLGIAPRIQTSFNSQAQYQEVLDSYYQNQLEYMRDAAVLSRVDQRLREDKSMTAVPPPVNLKAVRGQGSFFQMVVESTDFEYARKYAELWAKEFVQFKLHLKKEAFDGAARVTREEVIGYEERLKTAREAIQNFKRQHNIGSVKETGAAAQQLLEQLLAEQTKYSTLRQLLENTSKEDIASGGLMDRTLTTADKTAGGRGAPDAKDSSDPMAKFNTGSKYRDLKLQLKSKESELELLAKDLKPKHPRMVALTQEVSRLKQEMTFELDLIEESRRALLASYAKNERSYDPLVEKQKKIVLDSSSVQDDFKKLEEEETMIKNILDGLRKSLKDVELSLSTVEEDLTISQAGVGSRQPVAPNRPKIIIGGVSLGFVAALALIYFLHRMDDRYDLAEDIERDLEEPILGQVPQLDASLARQGPLLITRMPPHHMFPESIRGVRSSILLGAGGRSMQVLLVTSATPGDGKTTFTTNFAATLAMVGGRVLLIDADLRRGTVHDYFGVPRGQGLSAVLGGQLHWSDVVQPTSVPNLSIITSGSLPANPAELLVGPVTQELLTELRTQYDYVLIDSPPLTSINDTFSFAKLIDGLLFVVRSGQTSMRFARLALAALRQREAPVLGLVLNGITTTNPYYYYQEYYHAYYHDPKAAAEVGDAAQVARKMAAPKRKRLTPPSLAEEARALSGQRVTREEVIADEEAKAKIYKSRRASSPDPRTDPGDAEGADEEHNPPSDSKSTDT